jgi:hypothetical protein
MIQKRSLAAGLIGVVCAVAVLGSLSLFQFGTLYAPAAPANYNVAEPRSATQTQGNQSIVPGSNYGNNQNVGPVLSPLASQSIENPNSLIGVALLGAISLAIGIGMSFVISRRLG